MGTYQVKKNISKRQKLLGTRAFPGAANIPKKIKNILKRGILLLYLEQNMFARYPFMISQFDIYLRLRGCLILVGKDIELDAVGSQFHPYLTAGYVCIWWWCPCGVTWDTVPEQSWSLKLLRTPSFKIPEQILRNRSLYLRYWYIG